MRGNVERQKERPLKTGGEVRAKDDRWEQGRSASSQQWPPGGAAYPEPRGCCPDLAKERGEAPGGKDWGRREEAVSPHHVPAPGLLTQEVPSPGWIPHDSLPTTIMVTQAINRRSWSISKGLLFTHLSGTSMWPVKCINSKSIKIREHTKAKSNQATNSLRWGWEWAEFQNFRDFQ